jgi:hypothetical protein
MAEKDEVLDQEEKECDGYLRLAALRISGSYTTYAPIDATRNKEIFARPCAGYLQSLSRFLCI